MKSHRFFWPQGGTGLAAWADMLFRRRALDLVPCFLVASLALAGVPVARAAPGSEAVPTPESGAADGDRPVAPAERPDESEPNEVEPGESESESNESAEPPTTAAPADPGPDGSGPRDPWERSDSSRAVSAASTTAGPADPAPPAQPDMDDASSSPSPDAAEPPQPRASRRAFASPRPSPSRAIDRQRKVGLGMLIAGYSLFASAYLASAFTGTSNIDAARELDDGDPDGDQQVAYGQRMLIPIAGPFAAAPVAPSATDGLYTALAGVAQVGGLGLGIAGSVLFARAQKRREKLSFAASPRMGGIVLQVRGRF